LRVTLCGTRGSVGRAGPDTVRYGGDTSSVAVEIGDGHLMFLDAGSGLANGHDLVDAGVRRIDILLTHLHMDHIQGLGFFRPLFDPELETHIWGPGSTTGKLADRLSRYLSPPLFPVRLRDLPGLTLHNVVPGEVPYPAARVTADLVIHPGPTLGYRVAIDGRHLAYLPDHEPALGSPAMTGWPEWISGASLTEGADLLIHDSQYTAAEYEQKVGWGHSSYEHCLALAAAAGVRTLVTFHHEPSHSDEMLDLLHEEARAHYPDLDVRPGLAGSVVEL
jgi:phosphoribosyl 1,2-cyclic phosphodiesterase